MKEEIRQLIKNNLLEAFLNNKPLYYDEIDYTRMPKVYERVKQHFSSPNVIHIIGTNGKGTTGRFLAKALFSAGYKVGHYTSPHILKFNERIWLNGADVEDAILDKTHQKLLEILTQDEAKALSYFEYTTLLAMYLYKDTDYIVLEAGLGGEHDATAVFDNILTLITPIAKDHEAFLGTTLQEITTTKVNAVKEVAISAVQVHKEVQGYIEDCIVEKNCKLFEADELITEKDLLNVSLIKEELFLEDYLVANLHVAIAALNYLDVAYTISSFKDARLFGRCSKLNEKIIVDVGHNVLAAKAILNALGEKKYILIYNTYKDKNYQEILNILKPIIKSVEIIEINDTRIVDQELLEETLSQIAVKYTKFNCINSKDEYLVFGSFSVVEAFLKAYHE